MASNAPLRNPRLYQQIATDFRKLYNPAHAWADAISMYLSLPHLRGFWPMTSINENGDVYDLSGQGRTLTNNGSVAFGTDGLVSYVNLATSGEYLSRPHEPGIDITGGLTAGCWFKKTGSETAGKILGKWIPFMFSLSGTVIRFQIYNSSSGSTFATYSPYSNNQWYFLAGRYEPGTTLAIRVNEYSST
ncbi:MAG: hypothetical protein D6706_14430, partial [Chloroflexi bacterium]